MINLHLGVYLDGEVRGGEGKLSALNKDLLKRIEDIESLDSETKQHLFFLIDNVIQNFKTKKAFV